MRTFWIWVLLSGLLFAGCPLLDDGDSAGTDAVWSEPGEDLVSSDSKTADGGGWPEWVTVLELNGQGQASVQGNLSEGQTFSLDFADSSSIACFPATENVNFRGTHVVYAVSQPSYSELTATVTPLSDDLDVSLYAYQIGTTYYYTPENLSSAVTCEAGYDAQHDSNPGASESVMVNAIANPYTVVVVVAGPEGVTSGDYELTLELIQ